MCQPRSERKFLIRYADYLALKSRLRVLLQLDRNSGESGEYRIRSLYFDTPGDRALREKLAGVSRREKFRLRYYGDNIDLIRLEKKAKENGLGVKITCPLTAEECELLITGRTDELDTRDRGVLTELVSKMKSQGLRPRTVVDYTREAYVYGPGNVRITFDRDIRSGVSAVDFLDREIPTVPVLDPGTLVLEVKFDAYLPTAVADLLQMDTGGEMAVSKYGLCRFYR